MAEPQQKIRPSIDSRGIVCKVCGCDQHNACLDIDHIPCSWLTPTYCSHCYNDVPAWKPGMLVYQLSWEQGQPTLVKLRTLRGPGGKPSHGALEATPLSPRMDLLDPPHTTVMHGIAASVLADLLPEQQARELAPLLTFAAHITRGRDWLLNEFQIRSWAADNTIPF